MSELVENYKSNRIAKIPLKEVTEHFKGKAVSKLGDNGDISMINLSDMDDTRIDYVHLKKTGCDEKSVSHHLLQEGSMLIASKGTVKKIAVFAEQSESVTASADVTVLRPTSDILGDYTRPFLAPDLGQALLDETNTGENVMNLDTQKIISIEIPRIPSVRQAYLVQGCKQSLKGYKRKLKRARQKWQHICNEVEKNLFQHRHK